MAVVALVTLVLCALLCGLSRGSMAGARATVKAAPIAVATMPFELPRLGLMDRVLAKDHWDLSLARDPVATAVRSQVWSRLPDEMPPALWPEIEQVSEVVLGADVMHPRRLALALDDPNLHIQIARQQRATLAWHEQWLGPAHPDSLVSRRQLAITLQAQGQPAEAEGEMRAMLAMCVQLLGAAHADTLSLRNELATLLLRQRRAGEAEREYRTVVTLRTQTLGAEHPLTLSSTNNLANAIDAQDRHGEAEAKHRAVLASRERALGLDHPAVLQSCFNLALALANQGKVLEAVEFSWRAEEGRKRLRSARQTHAYTVSDAVGEAHGAVAQVR